MKIIVTNLRSKLVTEDIKLLSLLDQKYSVRKSGYQYTNAYKKFGWDGKVHFFNKDGTFGTGLLDDIIVDLEKIGAEIEIEDLRDSSDIKVSPYSNLIELRDYQSPIFQKALNKVRAIIQAPTGCHAKGQGIIMYDGTIKKVEDIKVGDQLMGPDSKPRNVLRLCRGKDDLYKIIPHRGSKPFVVNSNHILSLIRTNDGTHYSGQVDNISVSDYLNKSKTYKHIYKLYRLKNINFTQNKSLPLEPYFVGIMLGDGSLQSYPILHNIDEEVINYYINYCETFENLKVKKYNHNRSCPSYRATDSSRKSKKNPITEIIRGLELNKKCENKCIPHEYKTASREDRLQLLAGLMDTDGSLSKNCFDFISKSKQLVEDVSFVARSVGLTVSCIKEKFCFKICDTVYYRICISGNTDIIPCKISRKQAIPIKIRKNTNLTGFKIEYKGKGEYYGFELDGDHLYLLDDFTVTHNSGKSYLMAALTSTLDENFGVLIFNRKQLVTQTYEKFQELGIECGICFGEAEILKPIMLTTIQSIDKIYDQFKDLAKFVIFDEIHEMCGGKFSKKVLKAFPEAYYRWGFTATIPKDKEKQLVLKSSFGPTIKEVTAKSLVEENRLAKPNIYMISINQTTEVDGKTVDELDNYPDEYANFIVNCDERNEKIAKLAKTLINQKRKVLIVVKSLEHANILEGLIPQAVKLEGKDDMDIRKKEIEIFRNAKDGVCVIGTVIFQTGVDVPEITDVINARGLKSEVATLQLLGRGMRLSKGKTEFNYYDFYDNGKYLNKHSNERVKAYIREGHRVEKLK